MALIRWEPARELQAIQQEVNRQFGSAFDAQSTAVAGGRWVPAMDLVESEGHYVLRADLPGVEDDAVGVELEDGVLTVSGRRESEQRTEKDGYRRIERASGSCSRSLTLPDGVDAEGVTATFRRGVLEVRIPKPEQSRPRKVTIEVAQAPADVEAA